MWRATLDTSYALWFRDVIAGLGHGMFSKAEDPDGHSDTGVPTRRDCLSAVPARRPARTTT